MASFRGTGTLALADGDTVPVTVDLRSRRDGERRVWGGTLHAADGGALLRVVGDTVALRLDIGEEGRVTVLRCDAAAGTGDVDGVGPSPI
ncbi:hypothetical protein GCM10010124_32180 [Pilimelia terevasa]|uniref:Uncharacterized protein n=1 Tax=Pilimelia terevasa TaxID=53372 RepID=A0A8J3BP34_9ACTN|nr:hypothetical protein [Pilimelia terevasa]GGK37079.1 hypothetical protein GCM10010124_32180 [Pilimelia terevasa]